LTPIQMILESANKNHRFLIKPTIRLVKYWNARNHYPFESFELEKWICNLSNYAWWNAANQKDCFFSVFDKMEGDYTHSQWIKDKISRAKSIVSNVRTYEKMNNSYLAETEVKKLFLLG